MIQQFLEYSCHVCHGSSKSRNYRSCFIFFSLSRRQAMLIFWASILIWTLLLQQCIAFSMLSSSEWRGGTVLFESFITDTVILSSPLYYSALLMWNLMCANASLIFLFLSSILSVLYVQVLFSNISNSSLKALASTGSFVFQASTCIFVFNLCLHAL